MAVAFYPSFPRNLTVSAQRRELERNLLFLIFVRISNLSTVSRALFRYVSSRPPGHLLFLSVPFFFFFFFFFFALDPFVSCVSPYYLSSHIATPPTSRFCHFFFFFFFFFLTAPISAASAANNRF